MAPDLRSKLDRVTDILFAGGVSNPVTYIEQLSYLIYLKLLDEEETDRLRERELRGEAARRPQLFRWTEWRHYSGNRLRNFVRDQVFPYFGSLVKEEPRIAEYFRDAVLEVADPHVLQQVVAVIDTIESARLGTDIKGDIFEYLLSYTQGQETLGQFRTPRQIRKMMVAMVDPDLRRKLARTTGPRPRRGQGEIPAPPDLPQGSRRTTARLTHPRTRHLRHRRLPPDDADRLDEPRPPRVPQHPRHTGQPDLGNERAHRGRPAPPLQGDPLESALRRHGAEGIHPQTTCPPPRRRASCSSSP